MMQNAQHAAAIREWMAAFQDTETPNLGLYLSGPNGSGKTVICEALTQAPGFQRMVTPADASAKEEFSAGDLVVLDSWDLSSTASIAYCESILANQAIALVICSTGPVPEALDGRALAVELEPLEERVNPALVREVWVSALQDLLGYY